ncbi:DNA translocase FtsK [Staphylococcus sp. SQ8-PEA]|uniref:DNA translocase FtsK n=1 Tax=Staphylococcus marylandisciuri TaxID=2981529 RepID=A0ABT2QQ92_9STAP|nr:DNA translocase FtsK [Staphylococcus marylandisciuri]MCU5746132.1 DNA translocase FtsK [Staphylococcus marylandisciuri]
MSWFDKLFGEEDSNNDYLSRRNKRRQSNQKEKQHTLLPQNNDIYDRPKGKFRFPMRVLNEEEISQNVSDDEFSSSQASDSEANLSFSTRKKKRHRNRGSADVSQQRFSEYNKESYERDSSPLSSQTQHRKSESPRKQRIQTDVLRAERNNLKSDKRNYASRDFKASEVPSAIFGTHKPKQLKNGMIPRSYNKTDDDKQSEESNDSSLTSPLGSTSFDKEKRDQSTTNQSGFTLSNDKLQTKDAQTRDRNKDKAASSHNTKNHNNMVSLENFYASQIVEEIRRERERKVLQKRQFKKALQQKRHQEDDKDEVQKAIDEMYANQAKRYLGESSLDMPYQSSSSEVEHAETDEEQEPTTSSKYNYEEVDLDQIRNVHNINDDEVVVNHSDSSLNSGQKEQESSKRDNEDLSANSEQHHMEGDQPPEGRNDFKAQHSTLNQSASDNNSLDQVDFQQEDAVDNDVEDAAYRDLNTNEDASETNEDKERIKQKQPASPDDKETVDIGLEDSTEDLSSEVEREERESSHQKENANNVDHIENEFNSQQSTHQESISNPQSNEYTQSKEDSTQSNNYSSKPSADNKSEVEAKNSNQSSKTKSNYNSSQTTPKSTKPFNVLMTPSDRKRLTRSQNRNKSKVETPQLKPEMKAQTQSNERSHSSDEESSHLEEVQNKPSHEENNEERSSQRPQIETNNNGDRESRTSKETVEAAVEGSKNSSSIDQTRRDDLGVETETQYQQASRSLNQSTYEQSDSDNDELQSHTDGSTSEASGVSQTSDSHVPDNNKETAHHHNRFEDTHSSSTTIRKGPNLNLPNINLLEEPEQHEIDEAWIEEKKEELNDAFYYFNVPAEVKHVTEGPSVTRFELSVEKGVKVSRITNLQDDIKMALAAKDIRIEAPIPGTSLVGIEVPNQSPTKVNLRSIIESDQFKNAHSKLTVAMGYRINNEPLLMDIAKTPHALIAGATGSGKSVCINSILMSLLYKNHPEELRLLLIDPKMVELAPYNDLPHLVSPVITDVKAATQSLKWAVDEMERRYKLFAQYHVRNITAFNKKASYEERLPKIVIVIDELADLMMMSPQEVEQSIARIAQKARACGIHMLVATQRPSVNVITGLIKANIPTRIAFMVSSSVDSRTILDSGGAERLLGYGDMLYLGGGMNKPIRVQGTFVSDEEIDEVVEYIKMQREPNYIFKEQELLKKKANQPKDELFKDVCRFMVQEGHISTSLIQRHFQVGYNRAARIVDQLEQLGFISEANGSKPREVYITESDLEED